jgi:hypothetical protein
MGNVGRFVVGSDWRMFETVAAVDDACSEER